MTQERKKEGNGAGMATNMRPLINYLIGANVELISRAWAGEEVKAMSWEHGVGGKQAGRQPASKRLDRVFGHSSRPRSDESRHS